MTPVPSSLSDAGGVPDFVAVGHVVRDVVAGGWRLGGTVTFAAAQAHRLGLRPGIVTRAAAGFDAAAELPYAIFATGPSEATTSFENVYTAEGRTQRVLSVAAPIEAGDAPAEWLAAPIALLGPVIGEVPPGMAALFAGESLVGVSAQGWVRGLDAEGRVRHEPWTGEPYWRGADVLFASDEDLAGDERELERWVSEVPMVVVTRSWRGARLFIEGRLHELEAYPAAEVDATGAGDTFATGFLVRYRECGDALEAGRFGAAAASLSVEGVGVAAMGTREAVEARLAGA